MSTFNFESEYAKLTPEEKKNYDEMMADIAPSLQRLKEVSAWPLSKANQ